MIPKKGESFLNALALGAVLKLRLQEEGGRWSKKLTFCKLSYHRKCKRRGVGGQKKPNFVTYLEFNGSELNYTLSEKISTI